MPEEEKDKYPYNLKGYKSIGQESSGESFRRPPGRPEFVERLDRDSDGKVSLSEFDGPSHDFYRCDRDGDGYLSEDEAPKAPPRNRRIRR